jgi:hypothetical protein
MLLSRVLRGRQTGAGQDSGRATRSAGIPKPGKGRRSGWLVGDGLNAAAMPSPGGPTEPPGDRSPERRATGLDVSRPLSITE